VSFIFALLLHQLTRSSTRDLIHTQVLNKYQFERCMHSNAPHEAKASKPRTRQSIAEWIERVYFHIFTNRFARSVNTTNKAFSWEQGPAAYIKKRASVTAARPFSLPLCLLCLAYAMHSVELRDWFCDIFI